MPSLVATTSTPARKPFVRTHYVRTNKVVENPLSKPYFGHQHIDQHQPTSPSRLIQRELQDNYQDYFSQSSKPVITKVELPSKPGCRSFATKECHTIPVVVPKKVPYEKCHDVPALDCFFVLKKVPDLECSPRPYQDCKDVIKDVPYLAPEEQCEDVPYEQCVEVQHINLMEIFIASV